MNNIPIDKRILKQFLKAGIIEFNEFKDTDLGVPQGGIISPVIANMVLDGIQKIVENISKTATFVRYADDFVVIDYYEKKLVKITHAIEEFMKQRGVSLHPIKTKIVSSRNGFTFLGFDIKVIKSKSSGKYYPLLKPSNKALESLREKLKTNINQERNAQTLIETLNPILRGWSEYFKYGQSSQVFGNIHNYVGFLL